jgi:hypothetical protein
MKSPLRFGVGLLLMLAELGTCKCVRAQNVPLTSIAPSGELALNPWCFSVSNKNAKGNDGTDHPFVDINCGGIVTYRIPAGAQSFSATLQRVDIARPTPAVERQLPDLNHLRVRFGIDGKVVSETVLDVFTPPEIYSIPVVGGKTLSIQLEEEATNGSVSLSDAAFSSQPVQTISSGHLLAAGSGYANLGTGARQVAFYDYHPGESVPLRVEFGGRAGRADVTLKISSPYTGGDRVISIPVSLQAVGNVSAGTAAWTVPSILGPATLDLQVAAGGQRIYSRSAQIAISKQVDISSIGNSTFGVHISSAGAPLLQDDFANLWGAKWARVFLRWEQIETQPGKYDWSRIDYIINLYRQQHMFVLGVMGEVPPKWISEPVTQMPPAYEKFVTAALEHFRGEIQYWDVYNEIDSKYYAGIGFDRQAEPLGDINLLREEMETIQRFDSSRIKVCCSTGGTEWLQYDKRLFDAGLLRLIDVVSMHPYQAGPPENSDNGLSYVEMVRRLQNLVSAYGMKRPVWSTEANWLIGPSGARGVTAPNVTDHDQSEFVVRVNLLSLGLNVPYFLHSPFYTSTHREVMVDSLASYAALASVFADASNAKPLELSDGFYGISASTTAGTVVALWSNLSRPAAVHVNGLTHIAIQDMYGNAMATTSDPIVSGAPIYLLGEGTPEITVPHVSVRVQTLPEPRRWTAKAGANVESTQEGVRVTRPAAKYDMQLESPVFSVSPHSCYLIRASLALHHGGVGVVITNPDAHKNLKVEFMYATNDNDRYSPVIRVETTDETHLQVRIQAANASGPDVSDFDFSGATISTCP